MLRYQTHVALSVASDQHYTTAAEAAGAYLEGTERNGGSLYLSRVLEIHAK